MLYVYKGVRIKRFIFYKMIYSRNFNLFHVEATLRAQSLLKINNITLNQI